MWWIIMESNGTHNIDMFIPFKPALYVKSLLALLKYWTIHWLYRTRGKKEKTQENQKLSTRAI